MLFSCFEIVNEIRVHNEMYNMVYHTENKCKPELREQRNL
jgi:hypothetical protein